MKKKKIFILVPFVIILLFWGMILFNKNTFILYDKFNQKEHILFLKKVENIIPNGGISDVLSFRIYHFKTKDIAKIKNNINFKKVDDNLLDIYNTVVKDCFIMHLDNEKLELFKNNFNVNMLKSNSNFYMFSETEDNNRYYFELLILDNDNNSLYSIISNYGVYKYIRE